MWWAWCRMNKSVYTLILRLLQKQKHFTFKLVWNAGRFMILVDIWPGSPVKGNKKFHVFCVRAVADRGSHWSLFITICLMFLAIKWTVNTNSRWELSHLTVEQTSSPSCGGVDCPFSPGVPLGTYFRSLWNVKSFPSLEVRKHSLLDCIMLIGLWQSRGGGNRFCLSVLQMTFLWDAALLRWVISGMTNLHVDISGDSDIRLDVLWLLFSFERKVRSPVDQ